MEFISIITAIHNGLFFNKIYWNSLREYTHHPFELIIIDNCSEDGSGIFFEQQGCKVIRNEENYSYPYCQNQGIRAANGNYLFFLNNDIIDACNLHQLDIISASGIENMGDKKTTQAIDRKWKRVKNPLKIFGFGEKYLLLMFRVMYGDWKKF